MIHRITLTIFIAMCAWAAARAQALQDTVMINFRQSKVDLDTAYMDNPEQLRHALQSIAYYHQPDSNFALARVEVVGAASPEGSVKFNEWLSRQRAQRIFDYVGEHISLPDSLASFTFLGRDWHGLRRLVEADSEVPYRQDVISLLNEIIEKNKDGEQENFDNVGRLKKLHYGEPYLYMYNHLFPGLREARVTLTFDHPRPVFCEEYVEPSLPEIVFEPEISAPEVVPVVIPQEKPFYMGLKTNMLFDALAVPNIGAEFYLGKNYTIVGNWMYGWWDTDRTHRYWRIYGGDIAVRKWFGSKAAEKPLQGHHVGLYGGVVTYDFENGGTGYMGGLPGRPLWARCSYYGGVEYGYSLPIAKRLNLDFSIGVGYLGGEYIVYDPEGSCYVWKETRMRHWFGPTKAEISLVWLIGRGNTNRR